MPISIGLKIDFMNNIEMSVLLLSDNGLDKYKSILIFVVFKNYMFI